MTEMGMRLSTGQWNVNTLMILGTMVVSIVVAIVGIAVNYALYGQDIGNLRHDFDSFRHDAATMDRVTTMQQDESRDVTGLTSSLASANLRMDSAITQINVLDRSQATMEAEIKNLENAVTELRRQGRNDVRSIPPPSSDGFVPK